MVMVNHNLRDAFPGFAIMVAPANPSGCNSTTHYLIDISRFILSCIFSDKPVSGSTFYLLGNNCNDCGHSGNPTHTLDILEKAVQERTKERVKDRANMLSRFGCMFFYYHLTNLSLLKYFPINRPKYDIDIKVRTTGKYRESMGILPARLRKWPC